MTLPWQQKSKHKPKIKKLISANTLNDLAVNLLNILVFLLIFSPVIILIFALLFK